MRYFISFVNFETNTPYGSGVVDAASEQEALAKLRMIGNFPDLEPEAEALVFTLNDDDEQGNEMLGKFHDFATMEKLYGPRDLLAELPDEHPADVAKALVEYMDKSPGFVGSLDPETGKSLTAGAFQRLEALAARVKGQIH